MRHRISSYREFWLAQGLKLEYRSFLTEHLFRNRRKTGFMATAYKIVGIAFCLLRLLIRIRLAGSYHLVIIHREICPLGGGRLERLLARISSACIFDFDDAIWLPMPLRIDQRKRFYDSETVPRCLQACQAVVAGNEFLETYASQYNGRVSIIPTPYRDLGGGAGDHAQSGPAVLVWIGNFGNEEYLRLVEKPLRRLAQLHSFVLRIIGSPEMSDFEIPDVAVEFIPWSARHEAGALLSSTIGIMPLYDRDYERGKCSFKLVQYASAGLPLVASPVGMNVDVISPGENGYLPATEEEWVTALDRLLGDSAHRLEVGRNAYQTYLSHFTPEANAQNWMQVFENAKAV